MKNNKSYILFLNNKYSTKDNNYFLKKLNRKTTIAVDGGIRFFRKNKIKPDILIGDFDSAPKLSKKYLNNIEVLKYPTEKDKTDSQLAVELALERGAQKIEICGALSKSEIDHTLGNIFLLDLVNRFKKKSNKKQNDILAFLSDSSKRIFLLGNNSIQINGKPGSYISIIPVQNNSKIKFSGLVYPPPADDKKLFIGDSLTLRNQFKNKRAKIEVSGKIIIVAYQED
ncbi:MAG: thiamine diphosphokinase [archaeon]|nr:thiamine diphosphokinase [archaeon]